ncbi:MAG TPA: acyl-CoA dehydrogenase [Dehalococcoidia bacterium]|nr:acyl-CoA dehydrogenase [Dehalococcoidia bacterium]
MSYITDAEQEAFRSRVRALVEERVAPRAAEVDRTGQFPWDIFDLFKAHRFLAMLLPKDCGGDEASMVTCCILIEEVSRGCATSSSILASSWLGAFPIIIAGSQEQKLKYLPPLARSEGLMGFGLTERKAGSDSAAMETMARLDGDRYILNGMKCFITHGGLAMSYTIFAKTDPEKGVKGISAFIVGRDYPGFSIGKIEDKMGLRGMQVAELVFKDCPVPRENLLGEEGRGFAYAMMTLDRTRPTIAAQATGIAQGALDYVSRYAKERVQFGAPIANLQAIQFMLADMAIQIEAARSLTYRAASAVDHNVPDLTYISAISKAFATDTAMRVTTDAVQVMGGYGYLKDHPVERMMRDAKITQIYEGTNQIQRLVISRSMLGR